MTNKFYYLLALLILVIGCGDKGNNPVSSSSPSYDQYVRSIRGGHFNSYPTPNANIGTITDRYFGNPRWESIIGTDGNRYVNMIGTFNYLNSAATAKIQFRLYSDGSFILRAFEINGEPQSDFMIGVLIEDMYEEVG